MLTRVIETHISNYLNSESYKIFFMWGPRRSGKTTLMKKLSADFNAPLFNFDLMSDREKFAPDKEALGKIAAEHKVVLIDEVQNYEEAALALKILFDEFKVKIIATGSSELKQKTKHFESLAGRFTEYYCLPLSLKEIRRNANIKLYEEKNYFQSLLEEILVFGDYPEVFVNKNESERIDALQNVLETYVLKDIISVYDLRNAKLAHDLLVKIALQIGQEVSMRELANGLGASVPTVANYVEIFTKNYILLPLPSFKTNMRRAVSAHKKLYFLDLGIRNILVRDFRPLNLRPDKGSVFENFLVSELYKKIKNERSHYSLYFYREYNGREVDIVAEDYKKNYSCFEAKYNGNSAIPIFPLPHKLEVVNRDSYFDIIEQALQEK